MLPVKYRLQKNAQFQKVFKNSRPFRTENLVLRVWRNPRLSDTNRFGFVISNKIEKRATRRNALKRQLRQIAGDLISLLESGYDIVTVVQKDFAFPYKQDEIKGQMVEGMKKAGILKN